MGSEILIPFVLTFFAGLSTVLGAFIFLNHLSCQRKHLGFFLGLSAGAMIYLSFVELLPEAIASLGFVKANLYFFIGIVLMALLDFLIPHHYLEQRACRKYRVTNKKLYSTGFMIALGLAIHNFPEGMAVFAGSLANLKLGLLLAVAIAIHNIPEGIAVAAPIYHATENKPKAIKYSFISGMAEPLGAILAYLLFGQYLSEQLLSYIFALVAGIMVYISLDELLPTSYRDAQGHQALLGIVMGMIIVSLSLTII